MSLGSYKFDLPSHHKSIIKVIGVGGGGSNAVNHMYSQGIKDVEFVVCNTDVQALKGSPVPTKLQIGVNLTDGLGAGANPEKGRNAALESKDQIRELLGSNTKMVFITAGMGGGTGTGAAPVIAKLAKDLDILTVGICTSPFSFEGKKKMLQAMEGINELKEHCDTVLIILNDRLRDIYGNLSIKEAFAQADNVLSTAAKSIAEIITVTSNVNVDFEDVKTVMKNSGAAVMGSSITSGENRARRAAEESLMSPLLDNMDILGAKKILLSITFGDQDELRMDELKEITDYIEEKAGEDAEMIWGYGIDPNLGENICVTVIATGFREQEIKQSSKKTVYDLDSEKQIVSEKPVVSEKQINLFDAKPESVSKKPSAFTFEKSKPEIKDEPKKEEPKIVYDLESSKESDIQSTEVNVPKMEIKWELEKSQEPTETDEKKRILKEQSKERIKKLKGLSSNLNMNPEEFKEKLEVPAYLRKNVNLQDQPHSSERNISRFNLNDDNEILGNNKFLHDNVD
jgi:cell division protein FtsZ